MDITSMCAAGSVVLPCDSRRSGNIITIQYWVVKWVGQRDSIGSPTPVSRSVLPSHVRASRLQRLILSGSGFVRSITPFKTVTPSRPAPNNYRHYYSYSND